jgi:beta-glucosidase
MAAKGQFYQYNNPEIERKIDTIVGKMTLKEKVDLLGGYKNGRIRALPKLNLPELKTASFYFYPKNEEAQTDYPSNLNLGATWDTLLVSKLGKMTAQMARANKIALLYGPNLNLYRAANDIDNGQHFSEDPFLTGRLGACLVHAIQSQKIMAAPLGYVLDYQGYRNRGIQISGDERAMEELYLAPFRAAVMQGKAVGIVAGKTVIAGEKMAESTTYLTDILKGEFLFEGIVLSDSGSNFRGPIAAKAGLDLELPTTYYFQSDSLLAHIKNQKIAEGLIDDKVKRLLRMQMHFGYNDKKSAAVLAPTSFDREQLNTEIARSSMVLLKNQDNFLPLQKTQLKSLALIGPFAKKVVGIDAQKPQNKNISGETSPATGIKYFLENSTNLSVQKGCDTWDDAIRRNEFFTQISFQKKGLHAEYFRNKNLEGKTDYQTTETFLSFARNNLTDTLPLSVKMTGVFEPENTGEYTFFAVVEDGVRIYVNDSLIIDDWKEAGLRELSAKIKVAEDDLYNLRIEYFHHAGKMYLRTGFIENAAQNFQAAVEAAKKSEAVIVCVGYDEEMESKGRLYDLPATQKQLLKAVIKENKNVIVVLTGGGAMDLSAWKDSVKAIFHTFYPGSKEGTALTDLIFGRVSPSGKLPFSWERAEDDNPTFYSFADKDNDKKVYFSEQWKMGYRSYVTDEEAAQPLYPFGYGLSYSSFDYKNLSIEPNNFTGVGKIKVSFDVINVGQREAADVPQLYIRDITSSQPRPTRELKAFSKVNLKAGETAHITLELSQEELSFYHPEKHQWITENGVFEAQIGHHVNDIVLKGAFTYSGETTYKKKKRKK